jgi:hypothetical protein
VMAWVKVTETDGLGGSMVVAMVNELVGYRGVGTLIVILVGGQDCIGAYTVRPL